MGRELRRVPLDFDWPLKKVWGGYVRPEEFQLPTCTDCDGSGYGVEARAIANTFYAHQIGGPNAESLAWCDKLGQAEVDNLVAHHRMPVWNPEKVDEARAKHGHTGGWEWGVPRTAEEVNALNRPGHRGLDGHDAINRGILIQFRCDALGITVECPTCDGHGTVATDEQRAAADAWEWTQPPTGDGYQLWETTSEGSPISPVFETIEALRAYAADNCTTFGDSRASASAWRQMLDEDFVRVEETMADGSTAVFI